MSGLLSSLMSVNDAHAHTETSFASLDPSKLEFREYYAAACPHCVNMKPAWDAAVADYSGPVKWRQIMCNDQHWAPVSENSALCKDVGGFPTMKIVDTSTGLDEKATEVQEYHGPRDAKSMKEFVSGFDSAKVSTDDMGFFGFLGAMAFGACATKNSSENDVVSGMPKINMFSASSCSETEEKKSFL